MLDPREEKKFQELRELCRELKLPSLPEIKIRSQVRDRNGVLILDDTIRAHSWNRNFYNMIMCCFSGWPPSVGTSFAAGNYNDKNTGGTIRTGTGYCAPAQRVNYDANTGIIVGSSETPVSPDHYYLQAVIGNGSGSGQLTYGTQSGAVATYDVPNKCWTITFSRAFTNNSGATIGVREVGLIFYVLSFTSNNDYLMVERSLLGLVPLPQGAKYTLTYTLTMDYSAID